MASFTKGEKVEVCSKEEGLIGSYYEATIICRSNKDSYSLQYKNLIQEEDHTKPLIETISCDEIRPFPPRFKKSTGYYSYGQQVDAFDNDGWWAGVISGKKGSNKYQVYFENSRVTVSYPVSALRAHLEWKNNNWTHSVFNKSSAY